MGRRSERIHTEILEVVAAIIRLRPFSHLLILRLDDVLIESSTVSEKIEEYEQCPLSL
jgi:hypothetical protein